MKNILMIVVILTICLSTGIGLGAIDNPKLIKLPLGLGPHRCENTPVIYQGRPLLIENSRLSNEKHGNTAIDMYVVDLTTSEIISRFGSTFAFNCAFVRGDELNVFGTENTKSDWTGSVYRFWTTDLKNWKNELVMAKEKDRHYFNTSVCKVPDGYLMAYESNRPVQWCFQLARSNDLSHWEPIEELVFADKTEGSCLANPTIRYIEPYYYLLYGIHRGKGRADAEYQYHRTDSKYFNFIMRSRDLVMWDLSPTKYPMMEPEVEDGTNSTDVDLFEYMGNTYLFYGAGWQDSRGTIRIKMYPGPMKECLESYFDDSVPTIKFDARNGRYIYPDQDEYKKIVSAAAAEKTQKIVFMGDSIYREVVTDPKMQKDGLIVEHLKFKSTWDKTSPLYAYVVYPKNGRDLPVIFNTPGYNETSAPYRVNLNNYLASEGWLMVWVDMRGRGGSAGKHDSGGVEIHDIYDAVQAVKVAYSDIIDIKRIGFQGESGGGGNAISCMVKLPDTFCVGASFFGMHDYAKWQEIIDKSGEKGSLDPVHFIGATFQQAPDLYMARNSTIGAANNPYSKIFLFNDEEEITCWPVMDRAFKKNADAAGLTNVAISVSNSESAIRTRHHSSMEEIVQTRKLYLEPLKNGEYPVPVIRDKGEFTVLGFLITKEFAIYCGDGQDAVARVKYSIEKDSLQFTSTALSSKMAKQMTFRLPKKRYNKIVSVESNHKKVQITKQKDYFVFTVPTLENTIKVKITLER